MKIATSFILAHSITAQAISVSFSLINGKPWRGLEYPAIFPSSYGVFNSSNSPGGRSRHKSIVYKNLIYSFHGRPLTTNDVWAFNFTSKNWAWLAGSSISPLPSYGNRGIPSVLNTPGFRESFVGDINRARNEYFLFGGQTSNGIRSDIWTFDLESNMWTWLFGLTTLNESPIYNSLGVWASSSTPGGRYAACGLIYPSTDEFLLYGGFNGGLTYRSDIWAFNLADSRWTWISGSSVGNVGTLAGAKGEWSTGFFPAARFLAADLVFSSALNTLYLFGGNSNVGMLNDLWAFKRDTLEWAWLSGSTTVNSLGICGTMGYPARNNAPGARIDSSLVYHDQSGLLILIGGFGYTCGGEYGNSPDTWVFDTNLNEWGWISGSSVSTDRTPVNYFTFAAVKAGAVAVDSETSAIYLFGGVGPLFQMLEGNVDYIWRVNMTSPPRFVSSALKASKSGRSFLSTFAFTSSLRVSNSASATVISMFTAQPLLLSSSFTSLAAISTNSVGSESASVSIRPVSAATDSARSIPQDTSLTVAITPTVSSSEISFANFGDNIILTTGLRTPLTTTDIKSATFSRSVESMNGDSHNVPSRMLSYIIVAAVLLVIIVTAFFCVKGWRNSNKTEGTTSTTLSEVDLTRMSTSSSKSFNRGHTTVKSSDMTTTKSINMTTNKSINMTTASVTMVNTTEGIYIPGGLQMEADKAFRLIKEIARGGGGSVRIAQALDNRLTEFGSTVIVKIPKARLVSEKSIALFHQEIALMNAFRKHRNIAKLLGYTENPHSTILKYYAHGSLTKWIQSRMLSKKLVFLFAADISIGISALHQNGIVHCDLKPDNVLIDQSSSGDFVAVISDFGISQIVTGNLLNVGAYRAQIIHGRSLCYAAPEVLCRNNSIIPLTAEEFKARDIYAHGLIIYSMLSGRNAWL